jgi:hypothetical protein
LEWDNSGMNIGLMPWENILGIVPHHRKLLHVASRPMRETQFLVPTLVKGKILLVEKMWERLRSGYLVGNEKFGTGTDGEGMKSGIVEWMREGLLWDLAEHEAMERAVKGASWYVFLLSFLPLSWSRKRLWQRLKAARTKWTLLTHPPPQQTKHEYTIHLLPNFLG